MTKKIKVAIAEDHDMVRQGMVSLLKLEEELDVVFDVANGQELLDRLKDERVDILLLDLDMPVMSGEKALPIISEEYPHMGIIIVSMHYVTDLIYRCVALGAKGFLPKQSNFELVIDAIHSVIDKGFYFDSMITQTLLTEIRKGKLGNEEEVALTAREEEIIELVCQGKRNKEIADALFVSQRTVEGHRRNISEKTQTDNAVELVIYALKKGIHKLV